MTAGNYNMTLWTYDRPNNKLLREEVHLGNMQRCVRSLVVDGADDFLYCGTTSGDVLQVRAGVGGGCGCVWQEGWGTLGVAGCKETDRKRGCAAGEGVCWCLCVCGKGVRGILGWPGTRKGTGSGDVLQVRVCVEGGGWGYAGDGMGGAGRAG